MTACSNVVLLEPWWNPAVEVRYNFYLWWSSQWLGQEQAFDRVHRIGQLLPVSIYKLVVQGTVEERMIKVSYAGCIFCINTIGSSAYKFQDKKQRLAHATLSANTPADMNLDVEGIKCLFQLEG